MKCCKDPCLLSPKTSSLGRGNNHQGPDINFFGRSFSAPNRQLGDQAALSSPQKSVCNCFTSMCATASQVGAQLLHKYVCNYFTSRCATASQAAIGHPDHLNLDSLIVLAFVSAFDLLPSSNLQDDESDRVLVHASMHLTTKLLEEWPRAGLVQVSKPPSQQNL